MEWSFAAATQSPYLKPPAPLPKHGAGVMKDYKKKGLRMRIVLPLGGLETSTMWVLHQVSRNSRSVTGLVLRIA